MSAAKVVGDERVLGFDSLERVVIVVTHLGAGSRHLYKS